MSRTKRDVEEPVAESFSRVLDAPDRMLGRYLNNYIAYSIGCALVWAVILVVVATIEPATKLHVFLMVFGGWVIGWASATQSPATSTRRRGLDRCRHCSPQFALGCPGL